MEKVQHFTNRFPNADFNTIEENCFPGEDAKNTFTAISPRNIEAALAETVQIAIPETYSGLLNSTEHYIPLNADCSNIDKAIEMMQDLDFVNKLKNDCKEAILSEPRLRTTNFTNELMEYAKSVIESRNIGSFSQANIAALKLRYDEEIALVSNRFWHKRRKLKQLRSGFKSMGFNKVIHFAENFLKN